MATKAKTALINAYLELIKDNEFDKITVTNLVESCGISRQTFYYHFDDVDGMIAWAFKNGTDTICADIDYTNTKESAKRYADFFETYDMLLVKTLNTDSFIKIYNLTKKSFESFITRYLDGKQTAASGDETEFFVSYCSNAFAGFVTEEIQKENRDYYPLMKKLIKSLKLFSK